MEWKGPRALVIVLMLVLVMNFAFSDVRAQTTTITNLSYPTGSVSSGSAKVTFDLSYYELSSSKGEVLAAMILDQDSNSAAIGTASSTPDACSPIGEQFSNKAVCGWILTSSSGTEHLTFNLKISTNIHTYNLAAAAGVATTAGTAIYSSFSVEKFSINGGNMAELTVVTEDRVPVTIDGTQAGAGTRSLEVNPGTHSISVPSIVSIDDVTRLKFDHWDDGSKELARTVNVESSTRLEAVYVKQYKLTLRSPQVNATGAGWYDDGSNANFSVLSSQPVNGFLGVIGAKFQFKGWYENGELLMTSNTGSIQMKTAHTLTAQWGTDYSIPIGIFAVILVAVGAMIVMLIRRKSS